MQLLFTLPRFTTLLSAGLLSGAGALQAQTAASPADAPSAASAERKSQDRLMPLDISVNGAPTGSWVLLERDGVLYAPLEAIEEWRVSVRPTAPSLTFRGQTYLPLVAIPGFESRINLANQSLELIFSPAAFSATRLASDAASRPALSPALPAAFLNYDLSYNASTQRSAASTRELGALLELGASGDWGVLTSSHVGRNLTSVDPVAPRSMRRLETTYSRNFLDSGTSLRLGDSTTRSGLWGRPVYFGGLQLSRNFGLTPGFVSQPLPSIKGVSSAPSTVELYINDALRQTSQVPTGPFAIDNFPLLTGAGQARVVVRDVLGRETVLVQPFFTNANLLEKGLTDWSAELGAVRLDLGTENANYGQRFASGLLRHGVSQTLTLEGRTEMGANTQSLGGGLTYALPFQSLGQLALAASRDKNAGAGSEWMLGLENSQLRHGYAVRWQGASRSFRQLALDGTTLPYKRQIAANYSYTSEGFGSLGLGFARIETYDRGPISTLSANYSLRLGKRASLTLSATHVRAGVVGGSNGSAIGASLMIPLDGQVVLAANVNHRDNKTDAYASASRGLTSETGAGWRTLAGTRNGDGFSEGGLYYQGSQGLVTADISASSTQQTMRLGAQGGLVLADGQAFVSRRVQESFAVVEVPGYADVSVGFQGSRLTRTNAQGVALLTGLQPYQRNNVRLDPSELPISAEIDSIELVAVPALRSAVKIKFPVRSGRAALIKLVFDDGEPAPAGAEIVLPGDTREFFVARRGETFVTGLQASNTLRLTWNGASCAVTVTLPEGQRDDIARVGPLTCSGVKR
ncbi:fimbria/pilus outer membrane usher protein [Polaromonas sp. SM01]|uniref:fimbria/pilus outer membrane usher protein n=1 Tax=Polaromonas sp. SM01 TaxID=3085630 RepID=UPI0029824B28|nr:fimbria/pilus outer membrane usher protein [Polaromonas sp. SM01]MDW5442464.1 fimbria/pilus outer membrane usher protein [Polaromonas sp. SM01]